MNWSIYNLSTGQIDKTVVCGADMLNMQFNNKTHAAIEGLYEDNGFYVENGIAKVMPDKPSKHHIFDFAAKQWVDTRTQESEWALVRAERDKRLLACDWTQLPDVPLETKEVWALYRQALRDITEQEDPFNIQWPTLP